MSIKTMIAIVGVASIAFTGAALAQANTNNPQQSAKGAMAKEEMMKKDAMGKHCDSMKKDAMGKDSMKKDAIKK